MNCLLCHTHSNLFEKDVFLCPECGLVFKNPENFWDTDQDTKRYSTHQNLNTDKGYLDFLGKFVEPLKEFLPNSFYALDFGCGPGPTLSILLEDLGGRVENYDPIFFPDAQLLIPETYDVVTSTEVIEHFKTPNTDWELLSGLVKENGILALMTLFYSDEINYNDWWYKRDPTHVVFYQEKTFDFIAKKYDLDIVYNDHKSIIILKKREL